MGHWLIAAYLPQANGTSARKATKTEIERTVKSRRNALQLYKMIGQCLADELNCSSSFEPGEVMKAIAGLKEDTDLRAPFASRLCQCSGRNSFELTRLRNTIKLKLVN